MTNPITTLSLVLNALLIAWIVYYHFKKRTPADTANQIVAQLTQTEPIGVELANTFHKQYYLNRADATNDKTRAIFFSFKDIISVVWQNSGLDKNQHAINSPQFFDYLLNLNFYAYLGKYDKNYHPIPDTGKYEHPAKNSTVIIQFANENGSVIENEIYDFGTLCPERCPQNEQITEPK